MREKALILSAALLRLSVESLEKTIRHRIRTFSMRKGFFQVISCSGSASPTTAIETFRRMVGHAGSRRPGA